MPVITRILRYLMFSDALKNVLDTGVNPAGDAGDIIIPTNILVAVGRQWGYPQYRPRPPAYVLLHGRTVVLPSLKPTLQFSPKHAISRSQNRRETARQLRIHAQLTRCFSAVAV